ncbi:DNA cytosine methyltransferase [Chromobacterium violaceum]|uniref:DNA (cytosine-5-)-methyltransferase n=1 Tax=Chromobacterium violaceum TaxID=536 RepID=A0A202BCY6_CHRVL|nr:DNA cytosine methyltransferase [Chromobacterium violaceum]OVE49416.1 modification methylase [Chromobacterium violaceum]
MIRDQFSLLTTDEIIVDLFAGGGGMSSAIEEALGRHVDIAINHDMDAISMHMANHPQTQHYCCDVFEVDPREACQGRPVGHLHGSPDCTHFSQAVGGQPRSKAIRSLGWVIPRWAGTVSPRSISMENVKQMRQWGPLIAKRCKKTGRVVTLEMVKCPTTGKMVNRVAEPGERVPLQNQFLVPDPRHVGRTWRRFLSVLRRLGYEVEHDTMVAADYGAATTRERLFLFARRDGRPIVWPEPTHHEKPAAGQKRWRPAADHIDFSDLGRSIFNRDKPLADATMRRIAKGMKKYVIDSDAPFIVEVANSSNPNGTRSTDAPLATVTAWPKGGSMALASPTMVPLTHQGDDRVYDPTRPIPTITTANRGEIALAAATLINAAHGDGKPGRAQRWGDGTRDIERPIGTITASGSGGQALAAATMVQLGYGEREGQSPRALDIDKPVGTVVAGGRKHGLASAILAQANGGFNETVGRGLDEPATTITTTGSQQQLVTAHLAHLRGNCDGRDADEPLRTLSAGGEHHGLVASHLVRQFGKSVGSGADEPVGAIVAGGGGKTSLVSYQLSQEDEAGALQVAAFLISYYGTDNVSGLDQPMPTATTRDRLALVTVWIRGEPWVIVDIKLRMFKPPELYGCQGFAPGYRITQGHDGRKFSVTAQVKMCGNSVSRHPARALIAANCRDLMAWSGTELKQRKGLAA